MYQKPFFLCGLSVLFFLGCVSVSPNIGEASSPKSHPQYWLKTSLYGGNFFDDTSIILIDTRPFSALAGGITPDGFTFYPPPADHTIPAGTLMEIIKVSYPDPKEQLKRPLYSPKDAVWVYFRVAKERGLVSIFRSKTHILIVPASYATESQVKTYLTTFLSTKDPNTWILHEDTPTKEAIWHKKPLIGMNKMQLEATLGVPLKKQFSKEKGEVEQEEFWHYDAYFIVFKRGLVSKIKKLSEDL